MEHESIEGGLQSCLKNIHVDTLTAEELAVVGNFVFSKEFCAYEGHFPGKPILPAIVQLAAVRILAETALETSLIPNKLTKIKFKGMVQPDDQIKVIVSLTRDKLLWQGSLKLLKDTGEIITSGNITLSTCTQ